MSSAYLVNDGYYYWDWSRHLQLSYLDNAPLIAYAIRAFTALFGEHEWSLYLIGLTAALITGWTVYRIASLLFDKETAYFSLLFWLLTPGVVRYLIFQITCNPVFSICWGLAFYQFIQLLLSKKTLYFYTTGLAIGFLLLSRYTGILLCVSFLLICLSYKNYRFVLLTSALF
jgi:4-amino-4-deoxy-L-arabinose transferase-like glycosyltransferase